MGDVVGLHDEKQERVWVCECGCTTFMLRDDGAVICAGCDEFSEVQSGGWLTDDRKNAGSVEAENAYIDVQGNGSVEFARRRVAMLAADDDATLIVVAKASGQVHAWSAAETGEQVEWCDRQLQQAMRLISGKVSK